MRRNLYFAEVSQNRYTREPRSASHLPGVSDEGCRFA
jgi:hypothetical protein